MSALLLQPPVDHESRQEEAIVACVFELECVCRISAIQASIMQQLSASEIPCHFLFDAQSNVFIKLISNN